jgi:DNA modification methylase
MGKVQAVSAGPKTGVIYRDDNLARLPKFADESIDLIYLDPPFFSNRTYEVIWGDESEIRSFKDRWKGGIEHYIGWMEPRLRELHRVLKPTGSIYLHCDPHASHYLKVSMDKIFGADNFRNEIIWHYYNKMHDRRKKLFPRATDTLLFYVKDARADFTFHQLKEKREKPIKQLLRQKVNGRMVNKKDAAGHVQYRISTHRIMDNVWRIPALQPAASEKLGYPTQKPEALLKRLVEASTDRGDVVLDPFCGCGTAVAVAHQLSRRWIGIDISPTALDIIDQRLSKLGAQVEIVNGISTVDDLRTLEPFEFQNFIIKRVYGTHSPRKTADFGIDGYSFFEKLPIQVKQSDRIGRNVVDNFETAIRRAGVHKGYIIGFSFTRGAYEEAARVKGEGLEIALVEVASLFEVERDVAPRPDASQLEADLLQAVRLRIASPDPVKVTRPDISAEDLEASVDAHG